MSAHAPAAPTAPPDVGTRARWRQWLVRGACALGLALLAAAAARAVQSGGAATGDLRDWLAGAAFTVIGGRVAYRRPANALGWLFLLVGVTAAAAAFLGAWADAAPALAWAAAWVWWPAYGLLPLTVLLFPTGRLPSRRWRWAGWVAVIGAALPTLGLALGAARSSTAFLDRGVADAAARPFLLAAAAGMVCAAVAAGAGAAALAARWRRAVASDRRQLTWPLAAGCAVVVGWALESLGVPGVWVVGGAALPVAAAVAIVRHGLYDLGTLFSRTITYAALTALLAALYVLVVMALTYVLAPTAGGILPEAVGALTIAMLFQPIRHRVQREVDRRFNRARYDAARAVDGFSSRLRQHVELDALEVDLTSVIDRTVAPAHRSLWLTPGRQRAVAAAPGTAPGAGR